MFNNIEAAIIYMVPCHWGYLSGIGKDRHPHLLDPNFLPCCVVP